MPIPEYEYQEKWEPVDDEHVLTVTATTGSPPRAIGKVRVFVDVDAEAVLDDYLGPSSRGTIENDARRLVDSLIAERYP